MTSVASANHAVPSVQDTETKTQRDARMGWWREARYGLFIHWGLYAVPAGTWKGKWIGGAGEWIMNRGRIPVADYSTLPAQFDPTGFDADAWVSLAKQAGMKYIVITAKHHDGFAMFKSQVTPFNIVDATPFKRDPLKELAAACQKQGMKFGFYYSQDQDWTTPGASAIGGHWDKQAQDGSFADYIHTKSIPQIKELLANYQPAAPSILWFDTPTAMNPQLASEIVAVLNQHPDLIWNNRLGGGYKGDTKTPEQKIPPKGFPGEDWETCMTINDTWGYRTNDKNFKSTETLLHNLIDIASKGGNYLLNVGPDAHGVIPAPEADRLKEIGRWLDVNGESIYGSGPTCFSAEDGANETGPDGKTKFVPKWDWRCTTKPNRIYIHLLKWPGTTFTLPIGHEMITKAYLLSDPQKTALTFTQTSADATITLPAKAPDPIATVLVIQTK
jgi:alpha-L-fucosidase